MSPETAFFLDRSRRLLSDARAMLDIELNDSAGRTAYLAAFHAAQALISEDTDRTVRTHKGVQMEFYRLTKDDPELRADVKRFLAHGFVLKTAADYGTSAGVDIPREEAVDAVAVADRFIIYVASRLAVPR